QNLVARLQREAVIDEREPGGGVGGQRDLFLAAAEVRRDVLADLALQVLGLRLEHPALHDEERILVERLPPGVDGRAHRRWVRGDVEAGQVHVVRRETELGADFPQSSRRGIGWERSSTAAQ